MNALLLPILVVAMLAAQSVVLGAIADSATRRTDVTFYSGNYKLKGWLVKPAPAETARLPAIVMAPGFSGVSNYQFYADSFAKAGFAVLLFDYPNFGESEGTMRQEVDPWLQVQAYRDDISFLTAVADIDP